MASTFNAKTVHKDGKAELKIGIDKNAKILEGNENILVIKNSDGSRAELSTQNIPCIPEDATKDNPLVTQKDLDEMKKYIGEIISAANSLARIVGSSDDEKGGDV